jgi:hypothetical protein
MALFFTYGTSVDSLLTTTLSKWTDNDMVLNTFNKTPTLKRLMEQKKTIDGGASMIVPITYGANSTVKAYAYDGLLDTTPQEGILAAQAAWKQYAGALVVNGQEVRMNSGKEKVIDLVKAKLQQLEESFRAQLTTDLFATSTATNSITCMPTIFDATTTIQEIAVTSSWWAAGLNASVGSFAANGLSAMRTAYTTIDVLLPEGEADTIITTPTVYNLYEGSLVQNQRYAPSDKTGNASFQTLKFKNADVMYDTACNSGVMYMFPSSMLKLYVHSAADMVESEWRVPINQDVRLKYIFLMAQLVVTSRRKLYKLSGITA